MAMTADDDLEEFIRLQKEKLGRERNGLDDVDRGRKQWDRSRQNQIKESVKENIPIRTDTPEVPLAAKLGQHEEKRKRLAEEKRREYNELVSRQNGRGRGRANQDKDNGAILPGLRDSQSAKQRKIAERNREYNEFLKSKQGNNKRNAGPLNDRGNDGMTFPSERPAQVKNNTNTNTNFGGGQHDVPRNNQRPQSRNQGTSPVRSDEYRNTYDYGGGGGAGGGGGGVGIGGGGVGGGGGGRQVNAGPIGGQANNRSVDIFVPAIDLQTTGGRDFVQFSDAYNGHDAAQPGDVPGADDAGSLPINDRAAEQKRKEEERNREYNEFLKQQESKRGRRRERSPSDADPLKAPPTAANHRQHQRARSVGGPLAAEPRRGWSTPRGNTPKAYNEILDTKRNQEATYRQGAFTMRPAVSEGDLGLADEVRKMDRLDDALESRKLRFRSELYGGVQRPKVTLDDDDWLDFYKSPSRYDKGLGLSRAHTTLDPNSFQAKTDRVKSAPMRDAAFPGRTSGGLSTSRDQYRLELEQQMKQNADNRRREKREQMPVNVSGFTEITRQNVDIDYDNNRPVDVPPTAPVLQGPGTSLLGAAGQGSLGPYNSPMDEAYYYYSRRDPLDPGLDNVQINGYTPTVAGVGGQNIPRRSMEEPGGKSRVTFGPATSMTPRHKNDSDLATVAAIPTITEDDQRNKSKQKTNNYQQELLRQIEENKYRKNIEVQHRKREEAKLEAEIAGYNPFGKGGGGAPLKDTQGNVFADLKRMHISNTDPAAPRAAAAPATLPVSTTIDIPMSVYDTYVSPRQPRVTPRQTNALDEPTFARGGHGIFGDPKSDAEKTAADRYKNELQLQIEEKKRREEQRKAEQKAEEEREARRIEEARLKMQREYEAELQKQKEKEENVRRRNEELKLQAEEKRREAERIRRELNDDRRTAQQPSRTQYELDRERARLTLSPPVPTLRLKDDFSTARRSPPIPTLAKHATPREDFYEPAPTTTRLDRAGSADVLSKLEVIRRQLQTERQRVENQLEKDKFQVDVFDPRLVKAAPVAAVPVMMSPPVVLSPVPQPTRKSPEVDVFETAALHKAPVTVKRPPVDPVNADALNEFNQYKNRDSDSRQKFRQMFPDHPTTSGALETQQLALLRHQEEQLNQIRQEDTSMGSKTMLKSESAYIDPDGIAVKPETARERRRKKKVQVESPKSSRRPSPSDIGSTTSLNTDMNKKNESRLKKLRDMNDDDSLQDPDDILDRFISRQQHQRPSSGTTLNDEEAWLRPSN